jgi:allantoicase
MGGHSVTRTTATECTHHFDPNYREFFVVQLEHRTLLQVLCISTRFFAGNPASDLRITLIDDLLHEECVIPIPHVQPDAAHWLQDIHFPTSRIMLHFKAGGITRIWAYGERAEQQPVELSWLSKNSRVVFTADDFFGGPDFALSEQADRSTQHMLGWESSRSAMGLQAVFPITKGTVQEICIDTYRHVNNYLRSAWVFSANLPENYALRKEDCPLWQITSSNGQVFSTHDVKAFFAEEHRDKDSLPTYTIAPKSNAMWTLETTFQLHKDALHTQSDLQFQATHICIMLLPHGGLHAIRVMGVAD